MKKQILAPLVGALLTTISQICAATPIVENFDSFSDSVSITNQIAGLTFSNATVLSAGVSLDDAEFPPKSGKNVIVDRNGPISIDFIQPAFQVNAFFTYASQLTFKVFDVGLNLIETDFSNFTSNFVSSGNPPNEQIGSTGHVNGIGRIEISGDPNGGSFVLDDLTFSPLPNSNIPEPTSILLVLTGLVGTKISRVKIRRSMLFSTDTL